MNSNTSTLAHFLRPTTRCSLRARLEYRHELQVTVAHEADARAIDLGRLGGRLERRGFEHLDAIVELPGRNLHLQVRRDVFRAIQRDAGCLLLEVTLAQDERGLRHDDA